MHDMTEKQALAEARRRLPRGAAHGRGPAPLAVSRTSGQREVTVDLEFEAELLAFALDGDTVQNLITVAADRWGLSAEDVMRSVRVAFERGELRLSIDDDAGASREVSARELTAALLAEQPYVWLAPTSRTFERLAALGRT